MFDDDKLIPAYGFGDNFCTDKVAFPFYPNKRPCHGFEEVLQRYGEIAPGIVLAGPTSFAPIIREAVAIVSELRSYHILVIIADGQVTSRIETEAAIVEGLLPLFTSSANSLARVPSLQSLACVHSTCVCKVHL